MQKNLIRYTPSSTYLFMEYNISIILYLIFSSLQLLLFIGGIFIGKNMCITIESRVTSSKKIGQNTTPKVSIDETKVVGSINTNNLEKKYDTITENKEVSLDIISSINKLKDMKG